MDELIDILTQNGDYTNKTATRDECHRKGYYHHAVAVFIINPKTNQILLQKRSHQKKLWPGLWDISAGGHTNAGEFGFQAAIRETKEEIGIDLHPNDLICIGVNTSEIVSPGTIDRHFNEFFVTYQDLDPAKLKLQTNETQAVAWFTPEEIQTRFQNNFNGLVAKSGCWERILKYITTR